MTASFQSRSTVIGAAFEDECSDLLARLGFVNVERRAAFPAVGIEIDLRAETAAGVCVVFECKATNAESKRRGGMRDTDNVKKAVADAFLLTLLDDSPPYIVLTTHSPVSGRAATMVCRALSSGVFSDLVNVRDDHEGVERLRNLAIGVDTRRSEAAGWTK